ncbi:glycerate kinase [Bifidobacterium sp. ESL0728]|uniref:glycerate kinase family protein n=1 Tax=Bifidobacterium sp. ESL0728 TaxID=2983220 RepID=UPI0023F94E0B|nr:glycerate kinase [Bifidobacterium sp. ESL0728]WEV58505.1 glycerate kinase [Bifidobacterium sp. ESL0728]
MTAGDSAGKKPRVLIAPDSFKGSLTAKQAADAIEAGVLKAVPDARCVKVPMADGGEGTVQSLVDATNGIFIKVEVTGPLGTPVDAAYGLLGDGKTAVIEMAAASGIQFIDEHTRNPYITTTRGTGELIVDALNHGVGDIIVGLGGSATNDGGSGMARALGVRFLDGQGDPLPEGGFALKDLAAINVSDLDPRLGGVSITLASDVTNPLTGATGASAVFGPQKGATPEMVRQLDAGLKHYAELIDRQLGRDVADIPGAGAAGGLGAGFLAFTDARMRSGVETVVEASGLKAKACDVDYCFTGEGGIDFQTQYGKTPMGVAQAVKEVAPNSKVIALAGNVGDRVEVLYGLGIDAIFGVLPGVCTLSEALREETAKRNISRTSENVMRLLC